MQNRRTLRQSLPAEPAWLRQIHGTAVVDSTSCATVSDTGVVPTADACTSDVAQQVCVVLTADCLPVLLCNRAGNRVAAAHAGWRGLAAGVLESTVQAMDVAPADLLAWLGPAIGPAVYEVGQDVWDGFGSDAAESSAFRPKQDRWLLDLYKMARYRLQQVDVTEVYGGDHCTLSEPDRFFSYRRDRTTGRMASVIWFDR